MINPQTLSFRTGKDTCCACGSTWLYDPRTQLCGYHHHGPSLVVIAKVNGEPINEESLARAISKANREGVTVNAVKPKATCWTCKRVIASGMLAPLMAKIHRFTRKWCYVTIDKE